MTLEEKAKVITQHIYNVYGTDTEVLMGIPASQRCVVELIVKLTLMQDERRKLDEGW